jgi:N-acyl-D-glutamate deacylase
MTTNSYDLVVLGGRVMDPETGLNAVRNLGVTDGKIVAITKDKLTGTETINAKGHVVSPGFIDCHVHTTDLPISQKMMLRDGVTTQLDLETGAHPVDRYYAYLEGNSQANYGACVNAMGAREQTFNPKYDSETGIFTTDIFAKNEHSFVDMEWSSTLPNAKQVGQISDYVDEGLKQGALGVGVAVGYMTGGVTPAETTAWQRLAGQYGRATYVHGRYSSQKPPATGMLGFEEILANAAVFGNGVYFHHMHQQALKDTVQALQLFEEAAKNGVRAIGEIYPYNFGASICGADYLKPENYGPDMGHTYKDIIETATLKPLTKKRYDHLMETNPGTSIMFYGSTDADMDAGLVYPTSVIGSDSFPMTVTKTGALARDWDLAYEDIEGHPRSAGTAGITLRRVREEKLMPLMTALSKMTYMVAKWLQDNGVPQMAYKGRIQLGADADITVFDPKTVTDNSTMQQGGLPTTGMPYVVVNGTIVVKDSKVLKGVTPGRPVRLPVVA